MLRVEAHTAGLAGMSAGERERRVLFARSQRLVVPFGDVIIFGPRESNAPRVALNVTRQSHTNTWHHLPVGKLAKRH